MNGKKAKALRRVAASMWGYEVAPRKQALLDEIEAQQGTPEGVQPKLIEAVLALPTLRQVYKRLKRASIRT